MKKKVKDKTNSNYLMAILALIICIVGTTWLIRNKLSKDENIQPEVPEHAITTKGPLDISLIVPNKFSSQEKFGTLTLSSGEGQIDVSHNGTNYPDLASHLSDPRNDLLARVSEIEKLTINGYEAMSGILDNKKYFFIYVDHAVYFLSTTSPDLYDELDAIAQSFQYLGD